MRMKQCVYEGAGVEVKQLLLYVVRRCDIYRRFHLSFMSIRACHGMMNAAYLSATE